MLLPPAGWAPPARSHQSAPGCWSQRKTPAPGTDTEVALELGVGIDHVGVGKSGTRGSGLQLPASSTRQVDTDLQFSSQPPQVATRPESVVKVTCSDLGPGSEGGGQAGEEGNKELELRKSPPPVSRILEVLVRSPAVQVVQQARTSSKNISFMILLKCSLGTADHC